MHIGATPLASFKKGRLLEFGDFRITHSIGFHKVEGLKFLYIPDRIVEPIAFLSYFTRFLSIHQTFRLRNVMSYTLYVLLLLLLVGRAALELKREK